MWILLGYTVGSRAAPQPLQQRLWSKFGEEAADTQHSVEGKNHHTHTHIEVKELLLRRSWSVHTFHVQLRSRRSVKSTSPEWGRWVFTFLHTCDKIHLQLQTYSKWNQNLQTSGSQLHLDSVSTQTSPNLDSHVVAHWISHPVNHLMSRQTKTTVQWTYIYTFLGVMGNSTLQRLQQSRLTRRKSLNVLCGSARLTSWLIGPTSRWEAGLKRKRKIIFVERNRFMSFPYRQTFPGREPLV